jgi:hypothetical protein
MPVWGTDSNCVTYAQTLNKYAAALPGVKVYSMVIPTATEFLLPENHRGFSGSQRNKENTVAENLSGVTDVNIFDALQNHIANEKLYARTDQHWQPLGAYYGAEVFAKAAGVPFAPISSYKTVVRGGYVGSMYSDSRDVNIKNDPEDFTLFIPEPNPAAMYYDTRFKNPKESSLIVTPDASNYYCSFLGTDVEIAEITGSAGNGRTLVVFKDSYGNGLIPFLTSSFDKIYVCDIRYFDINAVEFCKNVNATDLLFAVCTFTPAGVNGKYVTQNLNK